MARFATQARALAGGAGAVADELRQFLAHRAGFGLFVAALHIVQHPFERVATHGGIAAIVHILELDVLFARTEQDHFVYVRAQAGPRRFHVELVVLRQRLQHLEVIEVTFVPAANGATRQRQLRILDHAVRVEILLDAQTVTRRAGARRVVKREQARFQLAHAVAANRAGKVGGEEQLFRLRVVHVGNHGRAAGELQRRFKRFCKTRGEIVTHLKAVNHHLDGVLLLQFQLGRVGQVTHFAVNTGADIALACQVLQRFGVFALTLFNDWRQQHQAFAFRLRQHVIHHLAHGLCRQRDVVVRAARLTHAGIQQTQVVMNFSNGTDRGARVMRRGLLLDRDSRRQPFNVVDIRFFHQRQELTRVRRERFNVTTLSFGIQSVESQ